MARYINAQDGPVMVPARERGKHLLVEPYAHRHSDRVDALYVLEGDYYAQFVKPHGPLSIHPDDLPFRYSAAPVDAPAATDTPSAEVAAPALRPAAPEAPTPLAPDVPRFASLAHAYAALDQEAADRVEVFVAKHDLDEELTKLCVEYVVAVRSGLNEPPLTFLDDAQLTELNDIANGIVPTTKKRRKR